MDERAKRKRRSGCLVIFFLLIVVIVYSLWQMGEPARRAESAHEATRKGMTLSEVERLATGRHIILYRLVVEGKGLPVKRELFAEYLNKRDITDSKLVVSSRELTIVFSGFAFMRTEFTVTFDSSGKVAKDYRALFVGLGLVTGLVATGQRLKVYGVGEGLGFFDTRKSIVADHGFDLSDAFFGDLFELKACVVEACVFVEVAPDAFGLKLNFVAFAFEAFYDEGEVEHERKGGFSPDLIDAGEHYPFGRDINGVSEQAVVASIEDLEVVGSASSFTSSAVWHL